MAETKKTFKSHVKPLLSDYKKKTEAVFRAYNKEVKQKKITSITESNMLWNKKYKKKLAHIESMHDKKYKTLWTKYFSKKG